MNGYKMRKKPRIAGIVLAAGSATRMKRLKQLLPFKGQTILGTVIDNAQSADLDHLIVVLGHAAEEIEHHIDFTPAEVVIAKQYQLGQSASLKAGLSAVPENFDGALFLLGDQPMVSPDVIDAVVVEFSRSDADIIIPTYNGKRGNPVLIGKSLFKRLNSLTGDTGARALFEEFDDRITEIEGGHETICLDVDTWEDYQQLCKTEEKKSQKPGFRQPSGLFQKMISMSHPITLLTTNYNIFTQKN